MPTAPDCPPEPTTAERDLRVTLRQTPGICVLTGGQTGVDTMASQVALRAGLAVHLVFPHGLLQEDGPITPSRRVLLSGATVHELSSPDFGQRTWTCVDAADAVILIDPAGGDGCQETIRAAERLGRPLLNLTARHRKPHWAGPRSASPDLADSVCSFTFHNKARVLMVAGCRASLLVGQGRTQDALALVESAITAISRV